MMQTEWEWVSWDDFIGTVMKNADALKDTEDFADKYTWTVDDWNNNVKDDILSSFDHKTIDGTLFVHVKVPVKG